MRIATEASAAGSSAAGTSAIGQIEEYRRELTGYCYRMTGSAFDAEDAVQETMVRAWRSFDRFEGRSSLRSWLYRIATNVCYDHLNGRRRRALPVDIEGPTPLTDANLGAAHGEATWIQPIADASVVSPADDPAEVAVARESIRLAFVAALQHLPPRQRAVLILRDVLRWKASEVADLLGTTVVSVNSLLQRAHATLSATETSSEATSADSEEDRLLVEQYVEAFERYDVERLVALLHDDASLSMPPYTLWLRGRQDVAGWYDRHREHCGGSRLVPVDANGSPALAQYRPGEPGGDLVPFALQVLDVAGGRIRHVHTFLDTATLFPHFGLPDRLPARAEIGEQDVVEAQ